MPAWIREGLEKMEREKQKEAEKARLKQEREEKKRKEEEEREAREEEERKMVERGELSPSRLRKSKFVSTAFRQPSTYCLFAWRSSEYVSEGRLSTRLLCLSRKRKHSPCNWLQFYFFRITPVARRVQMNQTTKTKIHHPSTERVVLTKRLVVHRCAISARRRRWRYCPSRRNRREW